MKLEKMRKTASSSNHLAFIALIIAVSLPSCASQAVVKHYGTLQCFQANDPPEGKVSCEVSASAKVDNHIIFANDKPIQGKNKSAVFSMPLNITDGKPRAVSSADIQYFNAPAFNKATKYESLTVTPDGKWVMAATAFDRYKPGQEGYNMLLAWPAQKWQDVKLILGMNQNSAASDSVALRDEFKRVLGGAAYFKIEGLAAIPSDNKNQGNLLLGVREIGQDYEHPEYVIKLIKVSYHEDSEHRLRLNNDFKLIDYTQALKKQIPDKSTLALSSVEYNPEDNKLYFLTSYEESTAKEPPPDSLGAFLWSLPLSELGKSNPELLHDDSASCQTKLTTPKGESFCPIEFKANKAEGLAILGGKNILVVFDDDKAKTRIYLEDGSAHEREHESQSGYVIIELP